jgi:glutamyl-tRNA reductase
MEPTPAVAIVGLSVRDHDVAELARFTLARDERAARLPGIAGALGAAELVYLATCNRVELLVRGAAGDEELLARAAAGPFGGGRGPGALPARGLRVWSGAEAARHLVEVAAGLDSAQLGEREIRLQLLDAVAAARAAGTCGVALEALVEEALRAARRIHGRTRLGAGGGSLADIAVELLLERVRRTPSPVALVGVTPVTRRSAKRLLREGVEVVIVNRTLARARELAAELGGGDCLGLDEFRLRPPRVEAVLCATGAPGAVLDRAALERLAARTASQEATLVVDLAVPPDVEPEAARAAQVPRIGLDEILLTAAGRSEGRAAEAASARRWIDATLVELGRRLGERALAPIVRQLHRELRATALEGVERLLARHSPALDGVARDELERWAETLARRIAHRPTLRLRRLVAERGLAAARDHLAAGDDGTLARLCDELEPLDRLGRALRGASRV